MILAELAALGVHAEVTVARGSTGTFLLSDGEVRVDRGVAHDLVLPARVEADVVLVSGYVPAAAEALASAEAEWVALDAGRLTDPPPGGNAFFVSAEATEGYSVDQVSPGDDARSACVTRGKRAATVGATGRAALVRPGRSRRAGLGRRFAATLLVALSRAMTSVKPSHALRRPPRLARVNLALSLLYAAERHPDAEAVVDGGTRLTYAELRGRAARLAGGLCGARARRPAAPSSRCRRRVGAALLGSQWLGPTYVPLSPRRLGRPTRVLPGGLGRGVFLEADVDLERCSARSIPARSTPRRGRAS